MMLKFNEILLKQKREILQLIAHLEKRRCAQDEQMIEMVDAAQKEDLMRLLDHLIERGREELMEINLALERMSSGHYGSCKICGKQIMINRLKVLPATRLCFKCAQNYEKALRLQQHQGDEIITDERLEEFRYLLDEDILKGVTALHNVTDLTEP